MPVVEIKNLTKEYPAKNFSKAKITALKNFSLNVESGQIFGLLGPNGAGKTTLVKILLGIVFPTVGDVKVFDTPLSNISYKKKIGYLPENHRFPNYLTGEQVLSLFGKLSGMTDREVKAKTPELLRMVGMEQWGKTRIKKYSKGMMQRIGLAQSMINNPDLIFLDEPTDGVDPIGRKEIRDILNNLRAQGKTVFLNSHLLSEIELVCDRIAILNKGELIKSGTIDEITSSSDTYVFTTGDMSDELVNNLILTYKAIVHNRNEFVFKTSSVEDLNKLIDYLRSNKVLIRSVSEEKNTLESMFINLIEQQKVN